MVCDLDFLEEIHSAFFAIFSICNLSPLMVANLTKKLFNFS